MPKHPHSKPEELLENAPVLSGFFQGKTPRPPEVLQRLASLWCEQETIPEGTRLDTLRPGLRLIQGGGVRLPQRKWLLPGNVQQLSEGSLHGLETLARQCGSMPIRSWLVKKQARLKELLGPERVQELNQRFGVPQARPSAAQWLQKRAAALWRGQDPGAATAEETQVLFLPREKFSKLPPELIEHLLLAYQAELLSEPVASALALEARFSNVSARDLFRLIESATLVREGQLRLEQGDFPDAIHVLLEGKCTISISEGNAATVVAPASLGHTLFLMKQPYTGDAKLKDDSSLVVRIDGAFFWRLFQGERAFRRAIQRGTPELIPQQKNESSHQILVVDGHKDAFRELGPAKLADELAKRLAVHLHEHVLVLRVSRKSPQEPSGNPSQETFDEVLTQSEGRQERHNGWVIRRDCLLPDSDLNARPFLPRVRDFVGRSLKDPHSAEMHLVTGQINVTLVDVSRLESLEDRQRVLKVLVQQKDPADPLKLVYLANEPSELHRLDGVPKEVHLVPTAVLRGTPAPSILQSLRALRDNVALSERAAALQETSQATRKLFDDVGTRIKEIIEQTEPGDLWPLGTVRFRPVPPHQQGPASQEASENPTLRESLDRLARAATNRRVGLALGGGGGFGYVHVALIRKLLEGSRGVPIDLVSGCSFGALVGALFCAGGRDSLELLIRHPYRLILLSSTSLVTSATMEWGLKALIGPVELEQLDVPMIPVVTDADTGAEWDVRQGPLAYGVRASCSMPPLMAPIIDGNRRLLDGGIVANVPVDVLRAEGADLLIASNPISWVSPRERTFPRFPLAETVWRQVNPMPRGGDLLRLFKLLGRLAGEAQLGTQDIVTYRPRINSAWLMSFTKAEEAARIVEDASTDLELARVIAEVQARWRALLNNPLPLVEPDIDAQQVRLKDEFLFEGSALARSSQSTFTELVNFIQEHEEIESFVLVVSSSSESLARQRAETLREELRRRCSRKRLKIEVRGQKGKTESSEHLEVWLENVKRLEESSSRVRRLALKRSVKEAQARQLEAVAEKSAAAGEPDQARRIALQAAKTEKSPAITRLLARMFELQGGVECRFNADAAVTTMAWSPDGSCLAVGYKDSSLGLLKVEEHKAEKWLAHPQADDRRINALAWSPDGMLLASCGTDENVVLWRRTRTGLERQDGNSFKVETWNHWGLAFSPDGAYLLAPRSLGWQGSRSAGLFLIQGGHLGSLLEGQGEQPGRVIAAAWAPAPGEPWFATVEPRKVVLWAATAAGPRKLDHCVLPEVSCLAWLDRQTLAVGGDEGAFILRIQQQSPGQGVKFQQPLVELKTGSKAIRSVAWTGDGTLLTAVPEDNALIAWDQDGQFQGVMQGQSQGSVRRVRTHPRAGSVAVTWGNKVATVWDTRAGRQLAMLGGHSGKIPCAEWDPAGERLATACVTGHVQVWSLVTRDPQRMSWHEWEDPQCQHRGQSKDYPQELPYPSTGLIVPVGQARSRPVWAKKHGSAPGHFAFAVPVYTGQEKHCGVSFWTPGQPLPTQVSSWPQRNVGVHWNPQGTQVVLQESSRVSIWDEASQQCTAQLPLEVPQVKRAAWDCTGQWVAIGQMVLTPSAVMLWDGRQGSKPVAIAEEEERRDGTWDLAWSPLGDRLAVAYNSGRVHVYAVKDGRRRDSSVRQLTLEHPARRVAWGPQGKLLACADESGGVTLWDVDDDVKCVPAGQLRLDRCQHLVWSPKGELLFAADTQGHATIWKARQGGGWETALVLEKTPTPIQWAVFSKDSRWVIMMEQTGRVRLLPFHFDTLMRSVQMWKGTEHVVPVRQVPEPIAPAEPSRRALGSG